MIVVGIVGRPAAGKSTVAGQLAARGAVLIDADRIAHDLLDEPEVCGEVARLFGPGVLDADGGLSRTAVAARVFGPTEQQAADLAALERIVHPRVRQRILDRLAALRTGPRADTTVAVLDVPLLVQVGWDDLCDRLLLVECDEADRQRRMAARGWSAADRTARDRAWDRDYRPPPAEKTVRVDASADGAYTQAQVDRFWTSLPRD
jgi:dephospho-CoA kinase